MTFFYDIFFLFFSIVYLPVLIFKGKAHKDFGQRFGFLPSNVKGDKYDAIWIHGVSVGEILGIKAFVKKLEMLYPNTRIVVSTTTKTGQDMARKTFSDKVNVFYFPLDLSFVVKKAVEFIKPKVFFIMETELWPNTISVMASKNIPVILVNGRISDKSFNGYKAISIFLKGVFNGVSLFLMQTETDKNRIVSIGAAGLKTKVIGNIKYDEDTAPENMKKEDFGYSPQEEILIAGSTHPKEEEIVLECYKNLKPDFKNLRLIIAPRHIERVNEVVLLCRKYGFEANLLSSNAGAKPHKDSILIIDIMGKLGRIYSIGTVVFVGGSLVKKGGHNIIEPARFSRPIIFGPYMHNFRDMASIFLKSGAAVMVNGKKDLENAVKNILTDKNKQMVMGSNAKNVVEKNKGACGRLIDAVKGYING